MVGIKNKEQFFEVSSELLHQVTAVVNRIDSAIFSITLSSKEDDIDSGVFCLKNQWALSFEDGDLVFFSDDNAVTLTIRLDEIEEITIEDTITITTKTYIFEIEID